MNLLDKPKSKQSVLMRCVAVGLAVALAVGVFIVGVLAVVSATNKKHMSMGFWDSTFYVQCAFLDHESGLSVVLTERTRKNDYTTDQLKELTKQLEGRNMQLSLDSAGVSYSYSQLKQSASCALIDGRLVSTYVLYLPKADKDVSLNLQGKQVKIVADTPDTLKTVTRTTQTALGNFETSAYSLGGGFVALWCQLPQQTGAVSATQPSLSNMDLKYGGDTAYRQIQVQLPVQSGGLCLVGLTSDKAPFESGGDLVQGLSYEGVGFGVDTNMLTDLPAVADGEKINLDLVADQAMGIKINGLMRKGKQILCFYDQQCNLGKLEDGYGFVLQQGQTPDEKQLATQAGKSADSICLNGTSPDAAAKLSAFISKIYVTQPVGDNPISFQ